MEREGPARSLYNEMACHQAVERSVNLTRGQVLQDCLQRRNMEDPPGDGSRLHNGSFL